MAVGGVKGVHGHGSGGEGAGFVGEQNVHAARRLDAHQLPDHDVVPFHPQHIGRQHHGDHHRQPLRHGYHHNGDGQQRRVEQAGQDKGRVLQTGDNGGHIKIVVQQNGVEQIGKGNQTRRRVAQTADGAGQLPQSGLHGAFQRVGLELLGQRAVEGVVTHPAHQQNTVALGDDGAPQQLIFHRR